MSKAKQVGSSRPDVVFFGAETSAKIVVIAEDMIRYFDGNDDTHEISLKACSREGNVGYRFLDEPPWTVILFDSAATRMEFESYEMAYESLLLPLSRHGWHTVDCT